MTITWEWPIPYYPDSLDTYYTGSVLTDVVDVVVANHPNSLGVSIIAIETKLGVDEDPITGLGGVSFQYLGKPSNPSLTTIPTLWVDSTTVGFDLTYSYNSVDTVLGSGHDLVTLAASATTGGLSLSTQEIGNQAATGGTTVAAVETSLGNPVGVINLYTCRWMDDTWYGFGVTSNGKIYRHDGGTAWTEIQNTLDSTGDSYSDGVWFNGEIWTGARTNSSIGACSYNPTSGVWTSRSSVTDGVSDICIYGSTVAMTIYNNDYIYIWDGSTSWVNIGYVRRSAQILEADGELYVYRSDTYDVYQYSGGTAWADTLAPFTVKRMGTWNNTLVASGTSGSDSVVYKYELGAWTQLGSALRSGGYFYFEFIGEDSNNNLYGCATNIWYKYTSSTDSWSLVFISSHTLVYYGEFNPNDEAGTGTGQHACSIFKDAYTIPVNGYLTSTDWTTFNDKAEADQTMYIGTTAVTIDRSSAALTLADITLTDPIADQYTLSALNTAPASAGATGTLGEIRITDAAIYVCIATDTWVKKDLATW